MYSKCREDVRIGAARRRPCCPSEQEQIEYERHASTEELEASCRDEDPDRDVTFFTRWSAAGLPPPYVNTYNALAAWVLDAYIPVLQGVAPQARLAHLAAGLNGTGANPSGNEAAITLARGSLPGMGTFIYRGWGLVVNTIGASINADQTDVHNCTPVHAQSPPETHGGTRVRTCTGLLDAMDRTLTSPNFATSPRSIVAGDPTRILSLDVVADHWQDPNGLFAFRRIPPGVPSYMRAVRSPLGFPIARWFQEPAFAAYMQHQWAWRIALQG